MTETLKNRIFVGQLPSDITKDELVQFFSQFGELHDVYLPESTKARRMAFVTFTDRKCMYRALAERAPTLRGEILNLQEALPKGVPGDSSSKVAEPVPLGSARDAKRLFVTNLPTDTSTQELTAYFCQWGQLADVFYTSPNNFGYVTFEREADLRAILRAGKMQLRGTDIKISEAKPRDTSRRFSESSAISMDLVPKQSREEEDEPNSRLFVKGIPDTATEAEVKAYFSTYGEVKETYKMAAGKTASGKTPKFMFVTFSRPQEMWAAIAKDAHLFAGVQLRVSEAAPKPKPGSPATTKVVEDCRIYVKGVPKEVTDDEVHQYFSNFGPLQQVHRPKKDTQGLQFMFVTFSTVHDMARALAHEPHVIGEAPLQVTKARARPEAPSRQEHEPPAAYSNYPPHPLLHPPSRPSLPDFATDNPFLSRDHGFEDFRDPYAAAFNAFAQAQMPSHVGGGWGEPAPRPSYQPDVNRGKQIKRERYSPY
jgi:RNA recognition motif-containing protein